MENGSINGAVWDWLQSCPHLGDMFFSAGLAERGDTVLVPSCEIAEKYIDGTALYRYTASLTRILPISNDPNDTFNIDTVVDADKVGIWVEERCESGDLPILPDGYALDDVQLLPHTGGWVMAQDQTQMKYMLEFQIDYIH